MSSFSIQGAGVDPVVVTPLSQTTSGNVGSVTVQSSGGAESLDLTTQAGVQRFAEICNANNIVIPEEYAGDIPAYIKSLSPNSRSALYGIAVSVAQKGTVTSGVEGRWADFVAARQLDGGIDVNALVQQVLRDSYLENTKDLYFYAEKVKFYNEVKKALREEAMRAREFLSEVAGLKPGDLLTEPFFKRLINSDFFGEGTEIIQDAEFMDKLANGTATLKDAMAVANNAWQDKANDYSNRCNESSIEDPFLAITLYSIINSDSSKSSDGWDYSEIAEELRANGYPDARAVGEDDEAGGYVDLGNGQKLFDNSGNGGLGTQDYNFAGAVDAISEAYGISPGEAANIDLVDFQAFLVEAAESRDGDLSEGERRLFGIAYLQSGGDSEVAMGAVDASQGAILIKGELETYLKNTEERLNSVGDDAQLANVDLQNMLQKQQQTLQMMSNIAKMLHDTAMAVIRKIGG